jgi:hypothetical protein
MATIELENQAAPDIVAYEIECPRCYGIMTLSSDFDAMFYGCEDCDFILHLTLKK